MSREVAEALRGRVRVIAVNNQGIPTEVNGKLEPALAPWADVLYAADNKWWMHYRDRALKFAGLKVTLRGGLPFKQVLSLQQSHKRDFDPRPTHMVSPCSGYGGLHLAVHFGAREVWLCGFDMIAADKRRHWFGNYPSARLNARGNYSMWLQAFSRLAPVLKARGVTVYNTSAHSALRSFPHKDLKTLLAGLDDDGHGRPAALGGHPIRGDAAAGPGDGGVDARLAG